MQSTKLKSLMNLRAVCLFFTVATAYRLTYRQDTSIASYSVASHRLAALEATAENSAELARIYHSLRGSHLENNARQKYDQSMERVFDLFVTHSEHFHDAVSLFPDHSSKHQSMMQSVFDEYHQNLRNRTVNGKPVVDDRPPLKGPAEFLKYLAEIHGAVGDGRDHTGASPADHFQMSMLLEVGSSSLSRSDAAMQQMSVAYRNNLIVKAKAVLTAFGRFVKHLAVELYLGGGWEAMLKIGKACTGPVVQMCWNMGPYYMAHHEDDLDQDIFVKARNFSDGDSKAISNGNVSEHVRQSGKALTLIGKMFRACSAADMDHSHPLETGYCLDIPVLMCADAKPPYLTPYTAVVFSLNVNTHFAKCMCNYQKGRRGAELLGPCLGNQGGSQAPTIAEKVVEHLATKSQQAEDMTRGDALKYEWNTRSVEIDGHKLNCQDTFEFGLAMWPLPFAPVFMVPYIWYSPFYSTSAGFSMAVCGAKIMSAFQSTFNTREMSLDTVVAIENDTIGAGRKDEIQEMANQVSEGSASIDIQQKKMEVKQFDFREKIKASDACRRVNMIVEVEILSSAGLSIPSGYYWHFGGAFMAHVGPILSSLQCLWDTLHASMSGPAHALMTRPALGPAEFNRKAPGLCCTTKETKRSKAAATWMPMNDRISDKLKCPTIHNGGEMKPALIRDLDNQLKWPDEKLCGTLVQRWSAEERGSMIKLELRQYAGHPPMTVGVRYAALQRPTYDDMKLGYCCCNAIVNKETGLDGLDKCFWKEKGGRLSSSEIKHLRCSTKGRVFSKDRITFKFTPPQTTKPVGKYECSQLPQQGYLPEKVVFPRLKPQNKGQVVLIVHVPKNRNDVLRMDEAEVGERIAKRTSDLAHEMPDVLDDRLLDVETAGTIVDVMTATVDVAVPYLQPEGDEHLQTYVSTRL